MCLQVSRVPAMNPTNLLIWPLTPDSGSNQTHKCLPALNAAGTWTFTGFARWTYVHSDNGFKGVQNVFMPP